MWEVHQKQQENKLTQEPLRHAILLSQMPTQTTMANYPKKNTYNLSLPAVMAQLNQQSNTMTWHLSCKLLMSTWIVYVEVLKVATAVMVSLIRRYYLHSYFIYDLLNPYDCSRDWKATWILLDLKQMIHQMTKNLLIWTRFVP